MKVDEPFTGIMIGILSWASYLDGAIWTSGCCAGAGAMFIMNWLCTLAYRAAEERG